ncbi:hypothetical protein, partial [Chromobacterium sp. ASV23]|uniref:hypothetical protein n=1 Tax=Chromobacterium sp. ASV23 TaxID=2795110 RepID=UPI001E2E9999
MSSLVVQAFMPSQAHADHVVRNVKVQKEGVSVAQLEWVKIPLEVGQTLSAVYQFTDQTHLNNFIDQSRYLYGYSGTAGQVASEGLMVEKSGQVPGRLLTEADVGKTLELSVQARSPEMVGNTLTIDTRTLSENGVTGGAPPEVMNLKMKGHLELGQELSATYQFNANGGNATDQSTFAWGEKGQTTPELGATVSTSGQVPAHKIDAADAGKVLEVGVQAKNGAGRTGNTLKLATDMSVGDGNETEGGDNGKPIDTNAKPVVKALKVKGPLEVGKDLTGAYQFDANGGNSTDKSTFAWGEKGKTDAAKGEVIAQSGVVPAHTIVAADAGKVL